MSEAPERIWVQWPEANRHYVAFCEPPKSEHDEAQTGYIRADVSAARIADLERKLAEAREVKPLEWFEAELPSRGGGKYKADGYTIRRIEGLWLLDFAGESRSDWRFTSLQGAKDHAQFLHAARILSALKDTTP